VEGARYEKTDISAFPDHQLYPNSHFESRLDPMGREGRQVPLSLDEYQSKCKCVMYTGRNTQPFSFVSYVIVELKKIA
jgi:hypothetical protein